MYQILAYLKYWFIQVDDHSLHSPFVFKLYQEVIQKAPSKLNQTIEALRNDLLKNEFEFELQELGAGSRVNPSNKRKVKEIARNASTPPAFSALLATLIDFLGYQHIIELGTSLGLNTLYLSQKEGVKVITFEGDPILTKLATDNFVKLKRSNIELVEGNLDDTLEDQLKRIESVDFAYIDANHRYEPSIRYFEALLAKCHEKSLIVLDDIHWSKEMNDAWHQIKKRPEVTVSIDLFEGGLLFFDPNLTKGDYVLKF